MDVATAFLNAPMPQGEEESFFVKPPALLEQFDWIKSNIYWKLHRAVYGLRVSPRLWGKERDLQLKNMRFDNKGVKMRAFQSSIDVALWILACQLISIFSRASEKHRAIFLVAQKFHTVGIT